MPCESCMKAAGAQAPGAGCTGTGVLWFIGGFVVGAVATVVMVNVTGEKSITGLGRATMSYARSGLEVGKKSFGGL